MAAASEGVSLSGRVALRRKGQQLASAPAGVRRRGDVRRAARIVLCAAVQIEVSFSQVASELWSRWRTGWKTSCFPRPGGVGGGKGGIGGPSLCFTWQISPGWWMHQAFPLPQPVISPFHLLHLLAAKLRSGLSPTTFCESTTRPRPLFKPPSTLIQTLIDF